MLADHGDPNGRRRPLLFDLALQDAAALRRQGAVGGHRSPAEGHRSPADGQARARTGRRAARRAQGIIGRRRSPLRRHPRGGRRTARGRCGLLVLHRSGLAPPTPCRFLPAHQKTRFWLARRAGFLRLVYASSPKRRPSSSYVASGVPHVGRWVGRLLSGSRPARNE